MALHNPVAVFTARSSLSLTLKRNILAGDSLAESYGFTQSCGTGPVPGLTAWHKPITYSKTQSFGTQY